MEYNLLQKRHDLITQKFIDGIIDFYDYQNYEVKYKRTKHLFIICLN